MSVDGLRLTWRDEGTVAGELVRFTSSYPTPAMPLDQSTGVVTVNVIPAATVILWQASASPLTRFDYLAVCAGAFPSVDGLDEDGVIPGSSGELELTVANGNPAEQIWIEPLIVGLPYRRLGDFGRYNISAGGSGFAGTAGVVDLLRYTNTTSADVIVRFLLARRTA